uniref:OCIA domain-containing protein 1 n=1 Tax=Oryzias sinensis TaxID=183150 RepID=A0A8C7ZL14_9TELE
MSSTSTGFPEDRRRTATQAQLGVDYVPTEEEKGVLRECNQESFFYRSVPFSVISMAVTQALVSRGTLSPSPRFGSLPKVAFAGFCGYLAGKLSYMKTCQEKFKQLENSPLGEILRQKSGMTPRVSGAAQSEMSNPDSQSFGTMFQAAEAPRFPSPSSKDYESGLDPPEQTGRMSDFSAPTQSYLDEEEPRRKPVLYEDLRLKNRENYEVTLIQKADTMIKTPQEKEPERPKKQGKKNIYGDAWDE